MMICEHKSQNNIQGNTWVILASVNSKSIHQSKQKRIT